MRSPGKPYAFDIEDTLTARGESDVVMPSGMVLGLRLAGSYPADDARWQPGADDRAASSSAPVSAPPTRLRIASIAVDTPLEDLDLDAAGALRAPTDFSHAGWYAKGNRPGDIGPAVLAGHVDSKRGPAVFYRLNELRPGASVEVMRGESWVTFRSASPSRRRSASSPAIRAAISDFPFRRSFRP